LKAQHLLIGDKHVDSVGKYRPVTQHQPNLVPVS